MKMLSELREIPRVDWGLLQKWLASLEIEVTAGGLLVDERLVRTTELWSVCRKILLKHIRMQVAKRLAAR